MSENAPADDGLAPIPRRALPPVAALRAFDAVARLGGVRKAAIALDLDHAAVSRHLRLLETWTGAQLVVRTPGGVTLTKAGAAYHQQIAGPLDVIAGATLSLARRGEAERLHIWCVPGFASLWLMPRLERFQAAHPRLQIELRSTDASPNFSQNEADVQIQYAPAYGTPVRPPAATHIATFAHAGVFPVASSAYLQRMPPVRTAADLLGHTLIQEQDFDNWRAWFAEQGTLHAPEAGGPRLWHGHLTVDAARRGRGVALANHFLAADDLASGALVEVVGEDGPFPTRLHGSYFFLTRAERKDAPAVEKFFRWLDALANSELALTRR